MEVDETGEIFYLIESDEIVWTQDIYVALPRVQRAKTHKSAFETPK